jgi:hypothetical protein
MEIKIILKNIIKVIILDWLLNYFMKTKTAKHVGGSKEGSNDKEALEKSKLSVLSFAKFYQEDK